MTEEILFGNKLIAEFMGYRVFNKRYPRNHGIGGGIEPIFKDVILEKTKYHISWDWIMPVVEKIESTGIDSYEWTDNRGTHYNFDNFEVSINFNTCFIWCNYKLDPPICMNPNSCHIRQETKLRAIYVAIVEFIQEYNKIINYEEK